MSKGPWFSREEDARLVQLWMAGTRRKITARAMDRPEDSIVKRARKLGLPGLYEIRRREQPVIDMRGLLGRGFVGEYLGARSGA